MGDNTLKLLGLMRRANALEIGEQNSGNAIRSGKAKLLLLASDASENARHRAESFVYGRKTLLVNVPFTKDDISFSVGVNGCSMAAVTDIGFANALIKILAAADPEGYGDIAQTVEGRFLKSERRKKESATQEKNKRIGKRRTNINDKIQNP